MSSITALVFTAVLSTGPKLVEAIATDHPEDVVAMLAGTDTPDGHAASTGNTFPQIKIPWGFNDWVPQTNTGLDAWWFRRTDNEFHGMRCTHQPSPWIGDYGHFSFLPHTQDMPKPLEWSPDSDDGAFHPFLFNASLEGIQFEFVPTSHAAIMRVTYPDNAEAALLSVLVHDGWLEVAEAEFALRGRVMDHAGGVPHDYGGMYFTMKVLSGAQSVTNNIAELPARGTFTFSRDEPIVLAVATSFISPQQADLNLVQEVGSRSFKEVLTESRRMWAEQLGRVRADAIDEDQLSVFYTNLWKSMLFPRFFQEVNTSGHEVHRSPYTGDVHPGKLVTDSGFWDSYLSVYHLQSLAFPDNLGKTIDGWVKSYQEAGWLPQWASPGQHASMVGTMGDVVLADAIAKSHWGFLSGFDVDKAYQAIRKDAYIHPQGLYGRAGLEDYVENGFVPSHIEMSVSRTMHYYVSDAAIARAAAILGKTSDERDLRKRSKRYNVMFNKKSHFFEPKDPRGQFLLNYDPRSWGNGFTEAGAWQWRFYVPHDVEGLQELYDGGICNAIQEMVSLTNGSSFDSGFTERYHEIVESDAIQAEFGLYAHNNQPVHHILYVAKKAGCNAVADKYLRKVMKYLYTQRGWPGDEDNGEMASWYVLSALGLYQLEGAKDEIVLGSPALAGASIQLPNNRELKIIVDNQDDDNVYVQSITWTPRGAERYARTIEGSVMKYTDLMRGGTLHFEMGPEPASSGILRGTRLHNEREAQPSAALRGAKSHSDSAISGRHTAIY